MKLGYLCAAILMGYSAVAAATEKQVHILPQPQSIEYGSGNISIQGLAVTFANPPSVDDRFAASELVRGLAEETGIRLAVSDSSVAAHAIVLKCTGPVDPLPIPGEKAGPDSREAYRLTVGVDGVQITGRSSAAVFYGVQTLLQLARGKGGLANFPRVTISDWPSLPYRGTLVDVGSEGPMSTMEQVEKQIDLLAKYKSNQYFFYSEANIELKGYPLLNPQARFTQDQVRQIIAYARQRHIDVVPAVELFGHLHDLFRIEKYSDLADFPHGGEFDPANPKVKVLLADWIAQLSDLFPSPFVDIGFDETFSIQKAADSAGEGATPVKLFVDQLRFVTDQLQARGKHVMAFADIIVKFPGIVSQLPAGLIALPWYYDAKPDPEYKQWLNPLAEHNVPYIVLPGVSSWDRVAPDFDKTFENIDTLVAAGKKSHTLGMMNTVWTDDGQVLLQMSWPGMAYGAVAAWQSQPVDRSGFFAAYARTTYRKHPRDVAEAIAEAYIELNNAEQKLQAALGEESMYAVWKNPFRPAMLNRVRPHREDLRECRLHAEKAQEYIYQIQASGENVEGLPTLLVGAQLLDYAGMKYLYALEIADSWATLPAHPTREQIAGLLSQGIHFSTHSRLTDLMDAISQLRESYKQRWLDQYTGYRLNTALGRWDAEYEYWRRTQATFGEMSSGFQDNSALPPLDQLAGYPAK